MAPGGLWRLHRLMSTSACATAADARRFFVNAVDDPKHATAYLGGVVRRDGVTVAISTGGRAPALAGLLREAVDAWLPDDLDQWLSAADAARRRWKAQSVPMERRRPQLLETLNRLYEDQASGVRAQESVVLKVSPSDAGSRVFRSGSVSLVGAGPGDPELWTVRARRRLEEADLVLYDALVDANALRQTTKAQCFCVGKRARRDSVPQETIHRLMIRAASRGKRVVRLKGGDPFVFGRGGEEALALAKAGIPFEVVPGVTTAVAAPELAGIPVTHRGLASGFLVLAGHTSAQVDQTLEACGRTASRSSFSWESGHGGSLRSQLMAHGWSPETPAAIVCDASTPNEWTWTGRLDQMGDAEPPHGAAGVLVVGEVVRIREALAQAAAISKESESNGVSTEGAEAQAHPRSGRYQRSTLTR